MHLSKFCFLILSACFLFFGCTDESDFRYKGEKPDWNYELTLNREGTSIKGTLTERNKIYVTVDSLLNVFINGHEVQIQEFDSIFKYVYTNPNESAHLPESPNKVMVYFAVLLTLDDFNTIRNNPEIVHRKQGLLDNVQRGMEQTVFDLRENLSQEKFGKLINELDDKSRKELAFRYPINLSLYFPMTADIIIDTEVQ